MYRAAATAVAAAAAAKKTRKPAPFSFFFFLIQAAFPSPPLSFLPVSSVWLPSRLLCSVVQFRMWLSFHIHFHSPTRSAPLRSPRRAFTVPRRWGRGVNSELNIPPTPPPPHPRRIRARRLEYLLLSCHKLWWTAILKKKKNSKRPPWKLVLSVQSTVKWCTNFFLPASHPDHLIRGVNDDEASKMFLQVSVAAL